MKKRLLASLLSLCLIVGLLPTAVLAVEGKESETRTTALDLTGQVTYENVDNQECTVEAATTSVSDSCEGWAWDAESKTLTLDGLVLRTGDIAAITAPDGMTLVLKSGSINVVETTNENSKAASLNCKGDITIRGEHEGARTATLDFRSSENGVRSVPNAQEITDSEISMVVQDLSMAGGVKLYSHWNNQNICAALTIQNCKVVSNGQISQDTNGTDDRISISGSDITVGSIAAINGLQSSISIINSEVTTTNGNGFGIQAAGGGEGKGTSKVEITKSDCNIAGGIFLDHASALHELVIRESKVTTVGSTSQYADYNGAIRVGKQDGTETRVIIESSTIHAECPDVENNQQAAICFGNDEGKTDAVISGSTILVGAYTDTGLLVKSEEDEGTLSLTETVLIDNDPGENKNTVNAFDTPAEKETLAEMGLSGLLEVSTENDEQKIVVKDLSSDGVDTIVKGDVSISEDGTVIIGSEGATITKGEEGTDDLEVSGGEVALDGEVTIPAGETVNGEEMPNGGVIGTDGTVKKTPKLVLSPNGDTVYSNVGTTTFTYTYDGDGEVSAVSDDPEVADAVVDQNTGTVAVTVKKVGSTCITVSAEETESYTIPEPATYMLTVKRRSSGGSSSSTEYAITVNDGKNGSVSVSPKRAEKGDTVTITVKPDTGYELDELTVTDKDGDEIKLTEKADNKFTFQMPGSKVTVEASFAKDGTVQKPDTRFDDVAKSAWYYNAVEYVAENGIMSGVSAREFAPNAGFSRAMLAQTLYAMSGKPAVKAESTFADVAANAWYADAVNWAAEKGYVSGVGDGKFAPDASVTREQMALILYRYAGSPDASGMAQKEFTDSSSVSAYAVDAIRWAVHEGLISGMENNTLAPQGTATRAQVAQILMNFHQKLDK